MAVDTINRRSNNRRISSVSNIRSTGLDESRTRSGFLDVQAISPRVHGSRGADRGFIAGRSGSGKSFLAERLLTSYGIGENIQREFRGNIFIIDPNGTFKYPSKKVFRRVEDVSLNLHDEVVTYRPDVDQLTVEPLNHLWFKLFHYKYPLMVYVDETRAMEPLFGSKKFVGGNWLTAYLTRGRARDKGAILGAQRPVLIPRDIIGQAEWFYIFDLPVEDDRQTIAGTIGDFSASGEAIKDRRVLGRFEFWFLGPDIEYPVRMIVAR